VKSPHLVLCELTDPGEPRLESHSPHCLKVHRALELCGFAYERRHASRPDAHRQHNPLGQVPILLVDGEPVSDSTAILSRLDVLAGGLLTSGLDRRARAEALFWEEFADTTLNGFVVAAQWLDDENWPRTRAAFFGSMPSLARAFFPERVRATVRKRLAARDVARSSLEACWEEFEATLDQLEARAPVRGFWLGTSPTRADIALYAQLRSLCTALTPAQRDRVEAQDRLAAWMGRVDRACRSAGDRTPVFHVPVERLRMAAGAFG
jgi:glutathione S-transferase